MNGDGHDPVRYALVVTVKPDAEHTFLDYEAQVLPLLARHGGRLERRLRGRSPESSALVEIHILSFDTEAAFENYRADPERAVLSRLWDRSVEVARIIRVDDVTDELVVSSGARSRS